MLNGLSGGWALLPAGVHGAVAAAKRWTRSEKWLLNGHTATKRLERALISLNQQRCDKGGVCSDLSPPEHPGSIRAPGGDRGPQPPPRCHPPAYEKESDPKSMGNFPILSQSAGMEAEPLPSTCSPQSRSRARRCNLSLLLGMNK